jgi:large repetitive protein
MASINPISPYYTSAVIKTILNQSVYNMTGTQVGQLRDILSRIDNAPSNSLFTTLCTTSTVVNSITLAASDESPTTLYNTGDALAFTVTFSDTVTVTGTPEIHVVVGSNTRQATYASGSGSTALVFSYTVVSGDAATASEVTVATSALVLNSGTIEDFASNEATLTLPAVPGLATVTVN